jgi:hypothetical protein
MATPALAQVSVSIRNAVPAPTFETEPAVTPGYVRASGQWAIGPGMVIITSEWAGAPWCKANLDKGGSRIKNGS